MKIFIPAVSTSCVINTSKNSSVNCEEKRVYTNKVANSNQFSDRFTKSRLTFTSLHGATWYGTQEDRDALAYRIQLTPQKINQNMKTAKNYSQGLVTNYLYLLNEAKRLNKAIGSVVGINKQYQGVVKDRATELAKMNPPGSKIPGVGIGVQIAAVLSGDFIDEIETGIKDLIGDYEEIKKLYLTKGLKPIVDGYLESSNHLLALTRSFKSLMVKHKLKQKLKVNIEKSQAGYRDYYTRVAAGMESMLFKLNKQLPEIVERQKTRQSQRLMKKAITKAITFGLG